MSRTIDNNFFNADNLKDIIASIESKKQYLKSDLSLQNRDSKLKLVALTILTFGIYYAVNKYKHNPEKVFKTIHSNLEAQANQLVEKFQNSVNTLLDVNTILTSIEESDFTPPDFSGITEDFRADFQRIYKDIFQTKVDNLIQENQSDLIFLHSNLAKSIVVFKKNNIFVSYPIPKITLKEFAKEVELLINIKTEFEQTIVNTRDLVKALWGKKSSKADKEILQLNLLSISFSKKIQGFYPTTSDDLQQPPIPPFLPE